MNIERKPPTMTHEEMVAKMLEDPEVRAEYERLEREEFAILDEILAARREAGLTQAQVAERMGTKAPAVARLEAALQDLPLKYREALLLVGGEGMEQEQVAALLGLSAENLRQRLSRGRALLRERLADAGAPGAAAGRKAS